MATINQPNFPHSNVNPSMRLSSGGESVYIQHGRYWTAAGDPIMTKDLPGWVAAEMQKCSVASLAEVGIRVEATIENSPVVTKVVNGETVQVIETPVPPMVFTATINPPQPSDKGKAGFKPDFVKASADPAPRVQSVMVELNPSEVEQYQDVEHGPAHLVTVVKQPSPPNPVMTEFVDGKVVEKQSFVSEGPLVINN